MLAENLKVSDAEVDIGAEIEVVLVSHTHSLTILQGVGAIEHELLHTVLPAAMDLVREVL